MRLTERLDDVYATHSVCLVSLFWASDIVISATAAYSLLSLISLGYIPHAVPYSRGAGHFQAGWVILRARVIWRGGVC